MRTQHTISRPPFVADWDSVTRDTGHTINWSEVPGAYAKEPGFNVQVTAAAKADAVAESITIAALAIPLGAGTVLNFEGAEAVLAAPAAAGATTLTVEPLAAEVGSGKVALVARPGSGPKSIPAGTPMKAAPGSKPGIVPGASGSDEVFCLLATPAQEDSEIQNRGSYGVIRGGVIYENLLPLDISAYKSKLAANGTGFAWTTHTDSTS